MIVRSETFSLRDLPGRTSADPFAGIDDVDLSMRIVTVAPGTRNAHLHPRSYEAMYVLEGAGHFWEDGKVSPVVAGDCILVAPNTPHATLADKGVKVRLACFFADPDLKNNITELDIIIGDENQGR
ncbi:MAG: cupin domain-containing protein [Actinobacteria bacterium]|nr:cupin domain-containing protein [Actinomycetota bacterium]